MHELAVCQSVLDQVALVARAHGSSEVAVVELAIGVLSGVDPAQLERAFAIARAGTVAANATLRIEPVAAAVICTQCGARTTAIPQRLACGVCGAWQVRLVEGAEMLLQRVELITDEPTEGSAEPCVEPAAAR
jgi:hydrogenase nickel incorporation protein HypA/HybF